MKHLTTEDAYRSPPLHPSWFARRFPSVHCYFQMVKMLQSGSQAAKKGGYTIERRVEDSLKALTYLESVGVRIEVENTSSFRNLESPCVFISNHMSTLETFVFSCIIEPYRNLTFVIKEGLIRYPFFKHIMITLDPVVVTRENPRDDFRVVMKEGKERLSRNISVVVFPQTTRSTIFDPVAFNTIGVKLAAYAQVPVIPIAIKTDAWGNSDWFIRDFGKIDPSKPVHICFGDPIQLQNNGKEEHELIIRFIQDKLEEWS